MDNENTWRALRLGKFTASEIHRLLKSGRKKDELFGEGAQTYIHEKIAEIVTGARKDDLTGMKALDWGNMYEAEAIAAYKELYSEDVIHFGTAEPQFFPFNAFSGGSPDALTPTHVIEAKCPYVSANHVKWLLASRTLPAECWHNDFLAANAPEYYAQIQFNMLCTGREYGDFISYDPRTLEPSHRLAVLHVNADEAMQEDIRHRLTKAAEIVADALKVLQPTVYLITPDTNCTLVEKI